MSDSTDLGAFRAKRVERVWEHRCGGQRYFLHEGGRIECTLCNELLDMSWKNGLPSAEVIELVPHGTPE